VNFFSCFFWWLPLFTSSFLGYIVNVYIYKVSKKTWFLCEMCDSLTLKMKPFNQIKTSKQKITIFLSYLSKLPFFNGKFVLVILKSNFACKMSILWPMGQKDEDFLFWSTPEPMVTFLVLKKSHISLRSVFWDNL